MKSAVPTDKNKKKDKKSPKKDEITNPMYGADPNEVIKRLINTPPKKKGV